MSKKWTNQSRPDKHERGTPGGAAFVQ